MPSDFTGLYCTDEDIASECTGDYGVIVPNDQRVAQGADGTLAGWVLSSATVDFAAAGVVPGMAVQFLAGSTPVRDLLIVAAVADRTATLRRKAMAAGQGAPPQLAAGASVVSFEVKSALPQIAAATARLAYRFLAADAADFDPADFREACVFRTLVALYGGAHVAGAKDDTFVRKMRQYEDRVREIEAMLEIQYRPKRSGNIIGAGLVGHMTDDPDWIIPKDYPSRRGPWTSRRWF